MEAALQHLLPVVGLLLPLQRLRKKRRRKKRSVFPTVHSLSDLTLIYYLCRKSLMKIWASVYSIRIKFCQCNATIFLA